MDEVLALITPELALGERVADRRRCAGPGQAWVCGE
jgi:hypothetical protein